MADDIPAAEESVTFHVKSSNDAKFTFTLPTSTPVSELKNKLSSSEYADTPADRQRLIYSGRVLKDNETLATYKIKDGHTVHLVKSAASNQRQAAQSSAATPGTASGQGIPGVPTNIAAGTGNNPLAGLTGARYAGFAQLPGAGLFGPDGGMGPPPDTETMLNMLENPQFQSTMNEALQNPAIIDMMIQQNPMLRDMGPGVRQIFQSPEFRRMLTDPNAIRQVAQMQRAMGGLGGPFGGAGNGGFPAPGVTNTTPEENRNAQQQTNQAANANPSPLFNPFLGAGAGAGAANPFAALFGGNPPVAPSAASDQTAAGQGPTGGTGAGTTGGTAAPGMGNQQNPFAMLFNPALFGQPPAQPGATDSTTGSQQAQGAQTAFNPFNPQTNPFLRDPAALSQMLQALGGQTGDQAGANPFGTLFPSAAPPDNRPPEERYADQLRQLNDMGFYEFERNIEALRRSGGSVQGAVEYLLSHQS